VVPPGGYAWWYIDAVSEDKKFALTIIAFVGSVFSPYYAWSGRGDPQNHCALNVALYGERGARWAMTERGRKAVTRAPEHFRIGPSSLQWRDGSLMIDIDEIAVPIPRHVRGNVRLTPQAAPGRAFALDRQGRHIWQPIAPLARVEVDLNAPDLRWAGSGYHDANFGIEPLEDGFTFWTWARAHLADGAAVLYDAQRRDGSQESLALKFTDGSVNAAASPPVHDLPNTLWGMARPVRADEHPRLQKSLESAPFYTRSIIDGRLFGERAEIFHESLSLDRVRSNWVRALLPFRMPRSLG